MKIGSGLKNTRKPTLHSGKLRYMPRGMSTNAVYILVAALFLSQIACCSYTPERPVNMAHPTNFNVRNRVADGEIKYIFIHDTQEHYLRTLEIFQKENSVSAHYVINNHLADFQCCVKNYSDGMVTQMVFDKDIAHHVKGANNFSIGIEHVGLIDPITLRVSGGFSFRTFKQLLLLLC